MTSLCMEDLSRHLFIDIETVPLRSHYDELTEGLQHHWDKKSRSIKLQDGEDSSPARLFGERAGVYSEFLKVVCIGIGCLKKDDEGWKVVLRTIASDDEKSLLNEFCASVSKFTQGSFNNHFVGHNIREFDLPCLCRRFLINGLSLPKCLDLAGLPSWKVVHVEDTMDLWKFGDYKHYTSLDLLAEVFDVPSSKGDINGSQVADVYWKEGDLERISRYCMNDVYTTARVYLKLRGMFQEEPRAEFHHLPVLLAAG